MTLRSILPYYHPTTIVMLDDNEGFLNSFSLQLDENTSALLFTSPEKCLDTVNSRVQMMPLDRRCLSWYRDSGHSDREIVRFDLALIEQEISNPHRFADISVMIIDYAMPGMDGLEVCRRVQNPRVKKILLTGVADESIAVQAFNEGLIDRFILKSDIKVLERINSILDDLKQKYFVEVSAGIQGTLIVKSPDFLYDNAFIDYFSSLTKKLGTVEYYYVEDPQGILLVDESGNLTRLVVYSAHELESMLFELHSLTSDRTILKKVRAGKLLPCFWGDSDVPPEAGGDLSEFLYPAERIVGQQEWFCALVDNPPADIEYDPDTASYASFLGQQDSEHQ